MTFTITSECFNCQRCLSACPTEAIQTDGTALWIDVNRCTQCEGSHGVPQCWAVCPTNEGCVPLIEGTTAIPLTAANGSSNEYWNSWFTTYSRLVARLKGQQQSSYWRQWFEAYSQRLRGLQTQYASETGS